VIGEPASPRLGGSKREVRQVYGQPRAAPPCRLIACLPAHGQRGAARLVRVAAMAAKSPPPPPTATKPAPGAAMAPKPVAPSPTTPSKAPAAAPLRGRLDSDVSTLSVSASTMLSATPPVGVEDMIHLEEMTETSLLANLRLRYQADQIYVRGRRRGCMACSRMDL